MKSVSAAAKANKATVVGTWWAAPRRVVLEFPTIEDAGAFLEKMGQKPPKKPGRTTFSRGWPGQVG